MSRRHTGSGSSLSRTARAAGRRRSALSALAVALAVAVTLAAPAAARAQDGFLLGTPVGSLAIRAGYDRASAGSDIFSDPATTGALTLTKGDFSGPAFDVDLGVRISDRFDFVLGGAYTGRRAQSHYRDFTETVGDNQNAEIEQTTTFQRVPVTGSLKMYLAPRGRSVGKFAWIPTRISPYVGGGGGFIWYRFRQAGDFVDFATANNRIFTATLESSGWSGEAHAFAGVDYTISPRLALTAESRYIWGRSALASDSFSGFDRIDLSGIGVTAGLAVRF
jgi:hypothetical protein